MKLSVSTLIMTGAFVLALGASAHADLLGTSVTGSIMFDDNPNNYFDPVNGFVPAGFLNSAGPTVIIANPAVEFGYFDSNNMDMANFTGTQLIASDQVFGNANNWTMTFTDTAFEDLNQVSDNFPHGGVTGVLVGDQITLTWPGTSSPGSFTTVFNVSSSSATPEPGVYALLGSLGLTGAAFLRRRRAR